MKNSSLPVKETKLLTQIGVGFLGGSDGKEIAKRVNRKYLNFPVITHAVPYSGGCDVGAVRSSNPYLVVGVNEFLRKSGLRTITQINLEKILKFNILDLDKTLVDTGLVLKPHKSFEESNKYLLKDLTKQVKRRGFKVTEEPLILWLNQLELEEDKNAPDRLRFKLLENCEPVYAPILNETGYFSSDDVVPKTGLPDNLPNKGLRNLLGGGYGLLRLCLENGSNLGLGRGLSFSDIHGRVVVFGQEDAPRENLDEYLSKLYDEKEKQLLEIEQRYNQAKEILRGRE